jgi:hypothetical protein
MSEYKFYNHLNLQIFLWIYISENNFVEKQDKVKNLVEWRQNGEL